MGYAQELARRMSGFSNFAVSFSIICILSGGITSFRFGILVSAGRPSALAGRWLLFSLCRSAMAQIASAFPTAGGLYHWGSILGGRAGAGSRPGSICRADHRPGRHQCRHLDVFRRGFAPLGLDTGFGTQVAFVASSP